MKKRITSLAIFALGLFFCSSVLAQKIPVATFDFQTGEAGWSVKDMSDQTAAGFVYRASNYWAIPAGSWYTQGAKSQIRHSWVISPVIDLTKATESELYLTYACLYGTSSANRVDMYIQSVDSLDLTIADKDSFRTQWGAIHTNMLSDENGSLGADFLNAKNPINTTVPLNMAMHDGLKVQIGIRFFNPEISDANTKNVGISAVSVAGIVVDETAPVNNVSLIDSIGNTFVRGTFEADEICKTYWAVKAKGETVASLDEIKDNLGDATFVSSGTFDYNIPESEVYFEIADLLINTEYTLFYGAEDFKNNKSELSTMDFSSDNDLIAPIITSITVSDIMEVSAMGRIQSDEVGEIMFRVYESGWEPTSLEQFELGQGAIVSAQPYKIYDITAPADSLMQYFEPGKSYILYATVTDLSGNVSEIAKSEYFTTLADTKIPLILSANVNGLTNHGGILTISSDEPAAGFGDVVCYWVATSKDVVLTAAQVMSKENGLASGSAILDSATYDNNITLDNLEKNIEYAIHCIVVDASDNVSEVSVVQIMTTNELEEVPLFIQEFDVENQNYHFAAVSIPENGGPGWTSDAGNSRVSVSNAAIKIRDDFYDIWCLVGPIDISNILDIAAEWAGEKTYGNYGDKMSLWVSKDYAGDGVIDINNWTQLSQAGDFANAPGIQSVRQPVPAGMDTVGVYFGFRYYHDVWAHTFAVNSLKIFGKRVGETPAPVIDWVEAATTGASSANMTFAASNYGRAYWYLAEETAGAPAAPTMDMIKSGANAAANGYVEYTAGNFIDQNFSINNLKPNTTYHLYTAFRDLEYNWAAEVFYDAGVNVFTTKSLEMISMEDSVVYATGAQFQAAALSEGRLFWTVTEQGQTAPTSYDEIYGSFDKKGAFNYTVTDESKVNWAVNGLVPETAYSLYSIMTEGSREYYSTIKSVDFTTSALEVISAMHDTAALMPDSLDKYVVTFNVKTTSPGWIHLVMTAKDAPEPAIEDILSVETGYAGKKFSFTDPTDVVIEIDNLLMNQSEEFAAWIVVASAEYVSPIYKLGSMLSAEGVSVMGAGGLTMVATSSTLQMEATVTPAEATNKDVVWSSSDEAIATIDEAGLVTGVTVGKTTIKVSTVDGDFSAELEITVEANTVAVGGVTLASAGGLTSVQAGTTLQMEATVSPAEATNKNVTWSSSDEAIATVDAAGLVTGKAKGKATIKVTTTDGSYTAELELTIESGVSIDKLSADDFMLYPNPATTSIVISGANIKSIAIYNTLGRMIHNVDYLSNSAIDVSSLNGGLYLIKITTSKGDIVKTFVKK